MLIFVNLWGLLRDCTTGCGTDGSICGTTFNASIHFIEVCEERGDYLEVTVQTRAPSVRTRLGILNRGRKLENSFSETATTL